LEQATQWMLQTIGEDPDAAPVASMALLCRQYAQTFEGTAKERLADWVWEHLYLFVDQPEEARGRRSGTGCLLARQCPIEQVAIHLFAQQAAL